MTGINDAARPAAARRRAPRLPGHRRRTLVVREIGAEFNAVGVRTQDAFDRALRSTTPADWADDRVHPNRPGHAVIAEAFLRALDGEAC